MATKDEAFINENADEPFEAVFEVTDNSIFSFEIEDVAGNKTEINIDLGDKINRVPPVVTIVDPDKLPEIVEVEPKNFPDTNQDQPVTLVTDKGEFISYPEGSVLSEDKKQITYYFTENGIKTFVVRDDWK